MAHNEFNIIIFKIDDPPSFKNVVANGQLEKPLVTATLEFVNGEHTFSEHFVLMKNLRGPIIGLHFMRHNSEVFDNTHGLIHQVKIDASKISRKPQSVFTDDTPTIPHRTTTTIKTFVDHPSEWNTTGAFIPLKKFL